MRRQLISEDRGEAGETSFSAKPRAYNFSNLYQMNRDRSLDSEASKTANEASNAVSNMGAAVQASKSLGSANPAVMGQINKSLSTGADISNRTQNFSVENDALKKGQSAYQAGITGFYAGSSNPNIEKIRSYGNLYSQLQGMNKPSRLPENRAAPKAAESPKNLRYANYQEDRTGTDAKNTTGNRDIVSIDNLTWMLKTGRINQEQFYAAQSDPELYNKLVRNFS